MKRWLIALAAALFVGVIGVGAAYADNTSYHGGYNATGAGGSTTRCASCHRTHTGSGPYLIKAATTYGLCTSCHGTSSGVDVVDGVEWPDDPASTSHGVITTGSPDGGLKGGGFVNAFMNTTMVGSGNPTALKPSTSAHKVVGMTGYASDVVWGIGSGSPTGTLALECTTCHDPHGGSGGTTTTGGVVTRTPTYRILRGDIVAKVTGAAVNPATSNGYWIVPEDTTTTISTKTGLPVASRDFLVDTAAVAAVAPTNASPTVNTYYGQNYDNVGDNTGVNAGSGMRALSDWCAACHTRIHTAGENDPATSSSGDAIYNFRHATTGSSIENNLGTIRLWPLGAPGCMTCHVSHGSSAVAAGASATAASSIPKPGTAEKGGSYLDSSLLRANGSGVCELCHNK